MATDNRHTVSLDVPSTEADLQEVEEALQRFFYQAGLVWERLESRGLISGNGHHMAQKLAEAQVAELKDRWARKATL